MATKRIDPNDSYIVREMFACSAGHALPPGFTHWESGECCPWGHSDGEDPHLYWRPMMVATKTSAGENMWAMLCSAPNKWSHLPLAPKGLTVGTRVGTNEVTDPVKVRQRRSSQSPVRRALSRVRGAS